MKMRISQGCGGSEVFNSCLSHESIQINSSWPTAAEASCLVALSVTEAQIKALLKISSFRELFLNCFSVVFL